MKLVLLLAFVALSQGRFASSKVDPNLLHAINSKEGGTANIFVSFNEGVDTVLRLVENARFATREARLEALYTSLKRNAEYHQAGVMNLIEGEFDFEVVWITNQLYIRDAPADLVQELASRPDVKKVTMEEIIELDTIISGPIINGRPNQDEEEWGIRKIQAQEARQLLNNVTRGNAVQVIVSNIDTGVRHTHEALRNNFVGEYGWYDPYNKNPTPIDNNGHGTHTIGTIAGTGGIGVYPDAKWVACRGCATSSCSQYALLACAEFIVCPTLPDGTNPDCSRAPHLVSNSWGGGRGADWYDDAIEAFHVAKIIPLFSIGNSGPSCNTANSPGDRNVIGVGSTTIDDALSSFSSVGPTTDGRIKPEISAPGSNVLSAYNTADDAYRSLSGTSMASPHAAGLTSLLLAYKPSLKYSDVLNYARSGVDIEELVSNNRTCSGIPDNKFPNHHYGQGRINAYKSLRGLIDADAN